MQVFNNKQTNLRKKLRKKRQLLSKQQQRHNARSVLYKCQKQAIFRLSYRIGLYVAFDGELDTKLIIDFLIKQGKQVFIPVIAKDKFYFSTLTNSYHSNRFGIVEPIVKKPYHPKKLNLILAPLVGFDKHGNRLGMGAGFYDKSLAFSRKQSLFKVPKIYGLAHSCQLVDNIDANEWDVKMQIISS